MITLITVRVCFCRAVVSCASILTMRLASVPAIAGNLRHTPPAHAVAVNNFAALISGHAQQTGGQQDQNNKAGADGFCAAMFGQRPDRQCAEYGRCEQRPILVVGHCRVGWPVMRHRVIGIETSQNGADCDDGTNLIADRLEQLGLARHVPNPDHHARGPQWSALNSKAIRQAMRRADWVMHLDIDEFLNIHGRHVTTLTDEISPARAISIPWRFFGNARVSGFKDVPIRQQFTRCSQYPLPFPRPALMFKTLFATGPHINKPGIHAPRMEGEICAWLNGDGRPVSANFDPKRPVFVGSDAGNSLAQVNHYALKSIDSFLVKADRGLPNHRDLQVGAEYFALRNFNDINDKALATDIPALDDPEILRLHRNACDWHQTRANEIRDTEAGIALTTALAMMGDSRLPDPAVIQGIHQSMWRVFGPKAQK